LNPHILAWSKYRGYQLLSEPFHLLPTKVFPQITSSMKWSTYLSLGPTRCLSSSETYAYGSLFVCSATPIAQNHGQASLHLTPTQTIPPFTSSRKRSAWLLTWVCLVLPLHSRLVITVRRVFTVPNSQMSCHLMILTQRVGFFRSLDEVKRMSFDLRAFILSLVSPLIFLQMRQQWPLSFWRGQLNPSILHAGMKQASSNLFWPNRRWMRVSNFLKPRGRHYRFG